jgi:hypothetical protein
VSFVPPLNNMALEVPRSVQADPSISSFQHGVLEPRLTWMSPDASCGPGCRRSIAAGRMLLTAKMPSTLALAWKDAALFSCSAGEAKLMNHFVANRFLGCGFYRARILVMDENE